MIATFSSVLQPSLEYGFEMWNSNQCQAKALESIQLRACKYILGCSGAMCDEPACVHVDLNSLRDVCKQ